MNITYLFTDFGYQGPYVGELKSVLSKSLTTHLTIDLMHDAPEFNPHASAYLLAALSLRYSAGDACLAVVDPGVGNTQRRPLIVNVDGVIYCGPDNGLFSQVIRHGSNVKVFEITWKPDYSSESFHGRDVFAPALCRYLKNDESGLQHIQQDTVSGYDWPAMLDQVIYLDKFGNAVTGRPGDLIDKASKLMLATKEVTYARTFSEVEPGEPFWYINSMGLVEIAVNQGSAQQYFDLLITSPFLIVD